MNSGPKLKVTRILNYFVVFIALFLILMSLALVWRGYTLVEDQTNPVNTLDYMSTYSEKSLVEDKAHKNDLVSQHILYPGQLLHPGHYETIEETMARIKKNVVVTGTLESTQGQKTALFQIEGMPDRSFQLYTQLMDGFIITEISDNGVVLKNQAGDERIYLTF